MSGEHAEPDHTPSRRLPATSSQSGADRRPGLRVSFAARLLDHDRSPDEVATLTGVPRALLELYRPRRHPSIDGVRPASSRPARHTDPVAALRRRQRHRRAALAAAVWLGTNAGLALASMVSGVVEPALVSALVIAMLGLSCLVLVVTR